MLHYNLYIFRQKTAEISSCNSVKKYQSSCCDQKIWRQISQTARFRFRHQYVSGICERRLSFLEESNLENCTLILDNVAFIIMPKLNCTLKLPAIKIYFSLCTHPNSIPSKTFSQNGNSPRRT